MAEVRELAERVRRAFAADGVQVDEHERDGALWIGALDPTLRGFHHMAIEFDGRVFLWLHGRSYPTDPSRIEQAVEVLTRIDTLNLPAEAARA